MKKQLLIFCLILSAIFTGCKEDDDTPPRATANFSYHNCEAPCTVNFNNLSQNATTYYWNFGDGATSTETNPKHLYETYGTWSVSLEAKGEGGNHTRTKDVVIAPPVIRLSYKVDGSLVQASLVSATRNSPPGFSEIFSSGPGSSAPYLTILLKEPSGGFLNSFSLDLNTNSYVTDNTSLVYSDNGFTTYSTAYDVNGITLDVTYMKYVNGGIMTGTFSGTLKTSSGTIVQITEGNMKVMFQ